jgi:hypothetical protein
MLGKAISSQGMSASSVQPDLQALGADAELRRPAAWRGRITCTCAGMQHVVIDSSEPICTRASASSSDSRAAPACSVSPFSMKPAGVVQ